MQPNINTGLRLPAYSAYKNNNFNQQYGIKDAVFLIADIIEACGGQFIKKSTALTSGMKSTGSLLFSRLNSGLPTQPKKHHQTLALMFLDFVNRYNNASNSLAYNFCQNVKKQAPNNISNYKISSADIPSLLFIFCEMVPIAYRIGVKEKTLEKYTDVFQATYNLKTVVTNSPTTQTPTTPGTVSTKSNETNDYQFNAKLTTYYYDVKFFGFDEYYNIKCINKEGRFLFISKLKNFKIHDNAYLFSDTFNKNGDWIINVNDFIRIKTSSVPMKFGSEWLINNATVVDIVKNPTTPPVANQTKVSLDSLL